MLVVFEYLDRDVTTTLSCNLFSSLFSSDAIGENGLADEKTKLDTI